MDRFIAGKMCRELLVEHNLKDWGVRYNTSITSGFLGLCSYKDKVIILSAHHVDTHPDPEILNTIRHEVAHALTQGHGHDEVWAAKAKELGCTSIGPCSSLTFNETVIDAIRSGADVEITFETEVIHRPKYTITRLQDKCPDCGKVAVEKRNFTMQSNSDTKPDTKFIFLDCGHLLIKKIPKGTPFQSLVSNWWKNPPCDHEWDKNTCLKCSENRAFPFQVEGARFLENALAINKGGALFDEMGLGKTIQVLLYLKYHPEQYPVLFIVKSAIKYQWFKELLKWYGTDHLAQIISTSRDYVLPQMPFYIASYDIFTPRKGSSGLNPDVFAHCKTIVLDECQQIKNPDATRTQMIRKLARDKSVIGMSGTPWKNRGSEFFTILNMLAPTKFHSHAGFVRRWVDFYYSNGKEKQGGIRNIPEFKEYIADIALRREVTDVAIEMPSVVRALHFTELEAVEQRTYDDEVSDFVKWYNDAVIGGEEDNMSDMNILAKMARMRHITGLAKIPATEEFVNEFKEETDRKLVIFCHHQDVQHYLYENIKKAHPDVLVLQLVSSMSSEERYDVQERFQAASRAFLVASTLASGEGINLQTCGDAIMHERQWNPQNEDQAAPGRFRRIGATHSNVNVTFMTAAGTIDEMLAEIVERKRGFFHNAMNKGEMPQWGESVGRELAEAIVKDFNNKNRNITKMASMR